MMKMTTIEDVQRDAPNLFQAIVNLGVQLERSRVIKHIDVALLYDAPLCSVRDAVARSLPLVDTEVVHDYFINAADDNEQAEIEAARQYGL